VTTLEDYRDLVRRRMGLGASDPFWTNGSLNDSINAALQHITQAGSWKWLQAIATGNTTPNNEAIAVADLDRAISVVLTATGDELQQTAITDILADIRRGKPETYSIFAGSLRLRPIPDSAYAFTVAYTRDEPALVDDSDEPLLPDQYAGALVAKASAIASQRANDARRVAMFEAEFASWEKVMRDANRTTRGPLRVRERPGGWV
jgi:hypothetical protein